MCERRSPWQQSPHGRRFFSSITESLPPVWTQLMEAHLRARAQVGSAHSDHAEELQSDVHVHRDVHGPGAEGGQQRTGGALWTSRSPGAQRLLPVRPVLPVPPSAQSPSALQTPPTSPTRGHYKERLVELINRLGCDPVVVFSPAEVRAELQRWNQEAPPRGGEEAEPEYLQRLRLVSG